MFKNYYCRLPQSLENKAYSFLNIAGLAVGMACSILILFWVEDERSYDTFHTEAADIYYIRENQTYEGGKIFTFGATPGPLAEGLKADFPEISSRAGKLEQ